MVNTSLLSAAVKYFSENGGFEQLKEVDGVVYKSNEWQELMPLTTEETNAVNTVQQQLLSEAAATEYQRLRKAEYDKLNQYEMMFNDQINGTTTWVDAINAIKAQYPKPE